MRFARGTRTGSPAAVRSPRTGSATIWAACMPSAHSPAPARQPPSACAAAPEDPPLPGAEDRGLRNQSDTAESAACPGSRGEAAAGVGTADVGIAGIGVVADIGVVAGAGAGVGTAADQPFADWLLADWLLGDWLLGDWPSGAARRPAA